MRHIEELASIAIDCGLKIHKDLGPGLLESVYEAVLGASLAREGITVERQKPVAIEYDGMALGEGFRADVILDGRLIIEIKSVERLAPVHAKQLLTYLRLARQPLGLLMNFGGETLREGLKRVVNNHTDVAPSREPNHAHSNDAGLRMKVSPEAHMQKPPEIRRPACDLQWRGYQTITTARITI